MEKCHRNYLWIKENVTMFKPQTKRGKTLITSHALVIFSVSCKQGGDITSEFVSNICSEEQQ